jgi:hypothetical protein
MICSLKPANRGEERGDFAPIDPILQAPRPNFNFIEENYSSKT